MLRPLISRTERIPRRPASAMSRRESERGVTLALVAVGMFAIIAMAALSIDIATLYQANTEAQRAADAAALTAARVISMSGMTGDPNNSSNSWQMVCGTNPGTATQAAQAVAQQSQNMVAGATTTATVSYGTGTGVSDCSSLVGTSGAASFAVNPIITVKVTQSNLRTYFSRIWFQSVSSISASATAEAYNPSNSALAGTALVPVQPRCVKPWVVPNYDPLHPPLDKTSGKYCSQAGEPTCTTLVTTSSGAITTPGVTVANGVGVIGEEFTLVPDCTGTGTPCTFSTQPQANFTLPTRMPNLQYVPGQVNNAVAVATGGISCKDASSQYAQAIAGCDQTTQFQCGVPLGGYNVDALDWNPPLGDTGNGAQCLIHSSAPALGEGQDALAAGGTYRYAYPFQIQVGSNSPVTGLVPATSQITSSDSIVSFPIYDNTATTLGSGAETPVTIVGFLQAFINNVNPDGTVDVVVMNIVGCGSGAATVGTTPLTGSSPVPVRLITPPPSS